MTNLSRPWLVRVLALLFAANLLNIFGRAVPAILLEPIRIEWALTLHMGVMLLGSMTHAITGIPLGLIADTRSRRAIMGWD